MSIFMFVVLAGYVAALAGCRRRARRAGRPPLRSVPALAALEEAVARAARDCRPVLYVPGTHGLRDPQTLASMRVLGHVARLAARLDAPLLVPVADPAVLAVAEEHVRAAREAAGRPGAFGKDAVLYLSGEPFAFAAAVAGLAARERPALVVHLGAFSAESLLLAEAGFASGAAQVAGTASVAQAPFLAAGADHSLIGAELFAADARLSRDPLRRAGLEAEDLLKAALLAALLLGAALQSVSGGRASAGWPLAAAGGPGR